MSTSVAMIMNGRREGMGPYAVEPAPLDENSGRSWKTESRLNAAWSSMRSLAVVADALISFGQFNFFRTIFISLQSDKDSGGLTR